MGGCVGGEDGGGRGGGWGEGGLGTAAGEACVFSVQRAGADPWRFL